MPCPPAIKDMKGIQSGLYARQIAAGSSIFDLCAFLLACLVVILVRPWAFFYLTGLLPGIYGLAGKVKGKEAVKAAPEAKASASTLHSI